MMMEADLVSQNASLLPTWLVWKLAALGSSLVTTGAVILAVTAVG